MRMIGQLPDASDAKRFVDYLVAHRVPAHAEEANSGWLIWVENDDHLEAGKLELAQFQANPADTKYNDAGSVAQRLRRDQAKAAERRQRNYRDVRTTVFTTPNAAVPATMVIIGLAVAVYVITNFGPEVTQIKVENALLFVDPAVQDMPGFGSRLTMFFSILHGQVWRLISPAFLHASLFPLGSGGILHILFNMMWMVDLGRRIEPVKGSAKFVGLVLLTGCLSCLAEASWYALSPWQPTHYDQFVGMSGVVSGLFGYAWISGKMRPYERIGVGQQELGYMIGWLVICTFGWVGPIANAAHWGGLAIGMLLGALPSWVKRSWG